DRDDVLVRHEENRNERAVRSRPAIEKAIAVDQLARHRGMDLRVSLLEENAERRESRAVVVVRILVRDGPEADRRGEALGDRLRGDGRQSGRWRLVEVRLARTAQRVSDEERSECREGDGESGDQLFHARTMPRSGTGVMPRSRGSLRGHFIFCELWRQ